MIHEPAIVALETVNNLMDKYEPKHNGAWTSQSTPHHAEHALNHILAFTEALGRGDQWTPEIIEDVESCLTRCAFILANIKRDALSDAPNIAIVVPVEIRESSPQSLPPEPA